MASLHATAILWGSKAVLIRGSSGAGKSQLALSILEAANGRATFAALISDDRVIVSCASGRLIAKAHPAISDQIEDRGHAIISVKSEPAGVIAAVVDLTNPALIPRLPAPEDMIAIIEGVKLPRLMLAEGTPLAQAASKVIRFLRQL